MKNIFSLKIIISSLVSVITVSAIVYAAGAAITWVTSWTIASGDTIGQGWFQQINDRINTLCPGGVCPAPSGNSVPSTAIMAFYSTTCPAGWIAANGSNGTPDLRGEFIRGLNAGRSPAIDDNSRGMGSSQIDTLQNITGSFKVWAWVQDFAGAFNLGPNGNFSAWSANALNGISEVVFNASNTVRTSTETRPRNVALLYCMKQ